MWVKGLGLGFFCHESHLRRTAIAHMPYTRSCEGVKYWYPDELTDKSTLVVCDGLVLDVTPLEYKEWKKGLRQNIFSERQ